MYVLNVVFLSQTFKEKMGKIHSLGKWTFSKSWSYWLAGQAPKIWYSGKLKFVIIIIQLFLVIRCFTVLVIYSYEVLIYWYNNDNENDNDNEFI